MFGDAETLYKSTTILDFRDSEYRISLGRPESLGYRDPVSRR